MKALVGTLKEQQEDFEYYPTTKAMINVIYNDLAKQSRFETTSFSMLDIGAGEGKIFSVFDEFYEQSSENSKKAYCKKRYAIEKSPTLMARLPNNVFVIGTDLWQQSLVDKMVDVIVSNPPYSSFEKWAHKIVMEANASFVYLVIPDRWVHSDLINGAIEARGASAETLGHFDFLTSEDRQARAKVSIVKIILSGRTYDGNFKGSLRSDPFRCWFEQTFEFNDTNEQEPQQNSFKERVGEIVKGGNLAERLEEMYIAEMTELLNTYKSITGIEQRLLHEIGVSKQAIIEALKVKIDGLKNRYWRELFSRLDTITNRLTSKSREIMLETLTGNTQVDFTRENIHAIVLWAVKSANQYFNDQIVDIFKKLSGEANVTNYKSNKHLVKDNWRYERGQCTHYVLDYRIIHEMYGSLCNYSYESKYGNGLSTAATEMIEDLFTIGRNLGFLVKDNVYDIEQWNSAKQYTFRMQNDEIFLKVRVYQNGNVHLTPNKKFLRAFNLEAGRLLNWIKSPQEASQEFDISLKEAQAAFGATFMLTPASVKNILAFKRDEVA
jgi:hypothetical protein